MSSDIILIGPQSAGKSTVGALLANQLDIPQCSMDEKRWNYYKEIGYDEALAKQKREMEGAWGIIQYWKPFEAYAVERLLSEHTNCVIDFGAGHSVYDDPSLFQRVQKVLSPYPNVVLLLPSPDLDKSIHILNERNKRLPDDIRSTNEYFVRHPSNYELAKFTVYTETKTPQETCDEILRLVKVQ
ncbi:MAG: shikimate kinase [Leptolyngbya sp. SIO1D8]|nr:shikimate kinase [Leptolyngbya sp. SIO1D8]